MPPSDSSLNTSTDADSMYQVLPTDEQVEVDAVMGAEQLVVNEPSEENISRDDPILKSAKFLADPPVELFPEKTQTEEDQPILNTVSTYEEMSTISPPTVETIPSEPTSVDSTSLPPAVETILRKSEKREAFHPMADTIPHETANSIMSLPLQELDVQSISESVKSAPAQLEHTIDPLLEPIVEAPVTIPSLKSSSTQQENIAELPVVPEVPVHPILAAVDESDELSSIAPPSEERFDHRQTLSTWAHSSSGSDFGVTNSPPSNRNLMRKFIQLWGFQ